MCREKLFGNIHYSLLFLFQIKWIGFFFLCGLFFSCRTEITAEDHPLYLDELIEKSSRFVDQHNLDGAFRYFDRHYNLIPNPGIGDEIKKYTFKQAESYKIGKIDENKALFAKSLLYADSLLSIIKSNNSGNKFKYENAVALFAKGDILFETGNYQESYNCFFNGRLISNQLENQCSRALFEDRFALLCFHQSKFRQAASLFLQAYDHRLSCKLDFDSFAAIQGSMDNAGLSYERSGMADSALACFNKAMNYIRQNAGRFPGHARFIKDAVGVTYGDLGRVYLDRGKINLAIYYFKKSIELNSRGGNEGKNTQFMQVKLADAYLETSNLHELDSLLTGMRKSLDTLSNIEVELSWQKLRWSYYNALKQPGESNTYLQNYLKLKDSADARERKIAVADAGSSFLHIQQNYDLDILKRENELHTVYLFFTIGFSIFILLGIFQVWRNWKTSTQNNRVLTELNHEIVERNLTLQDALAALEQSQEENTKIMEVVAHDLRSPIGAIVNLAEVVINSNELSGENKELLDLIQVSGKDSLKFVNELLSRHSDTDEMATEPVNLQKLLTYCVTQLQFKANEKHQRIVLQSEAVTLALNREKIWRVISNLIINSIKFSPDGAEIDVTLEVKAETVLIAVKDAGIGIPDELKDKIFNMVSKAQRPGTDGEKSFGLGLAISKQIIEAHGGKLWFESESKGTTFFVELPVGSLES